MSNRIKFIEDKLEGFLVKNKIHYVRHEDEFSSYFTINGITVFPAEHIWQKTQCKKKKLLESEDEPYLIVYYTKEGDVELDEHFLLYDNYTEMLKNDKDLWTQFTTNG